MITMSDNNQISQIHKFIDEFMFYLQIEKNVSRHTMLNYHRDIYRYIEFVSNQHSGEILSGYTHPLLVRSYLSHLKSQEYAKATIMRRIAALRSFFRFLCRKSILNENPCDAVRTPKQEKKLPVFLEINEVNELMALPDDSPLGLRDKALLELLYATGVRVNELSEITLPDIDFAERTVIVSGNGAKARIVLMGKAAAEYVERYLYHARPVLCAKPGKYGRQSEHHHNRLFVNNRGGPLTDRSVHRIVKKYVEKLALQKKVSPHTFRYTVAVHLLDNGADLSTVQDLLGYVNLSTTGLYTHTTERLKASYKKSHPRA